MIDRFRYSFVEAFQSFQLKYNFPFINYIKMQLQTVHFTIYIFYEGFHF